MAEAAIPEGDTPAQATLPCEECDETVDVADYCLDCPGALCPSCKISHQRRKITRNHTIVPYSSPEVEMMKNLAALGKCSKHPGNGMVSFCAKCDEPICVHCVTSDHKMHDTISITMKMEEVKREIESYRNAHVGISANTADEIEAIQNGIAAMRMETQQARRQLDDAMKSIRDVLDEEEAKLQQQITSHEDTEISALQQLISQNETRKSECDSRDVQCGRILNTNIREMMQFIKSMPGPLSQINKWNRSTSPLLITPGVIDRTSLVRMIAVVSNTTAKIPAEVELSRSPHQKAKKSDFNVNIKHSFVADDYAKSITMIGNGDVLISTYDRSKCRRYNSKGALLKKIHLRSVNIRTHVVDCNRIIAIGWSNNTVLQISMDGSSVKKLIDTSPLKPYGICVNHKGNIVVVFRNDKYKALVEYSPDCQLALQEIERDDIGNLLFPAPLRVVQNGNHDYIVTNNAEVVAVSSEGKLRWRNSGKGRPPRENKYHPDTVCCDRFNNVIVGDYHNHMVDILKSDGEFVMCLLSHDYGIKYPFALAIDDQDNLWVGSDMNKKIIIASYLK